MAHVNINSLLWTGESEQFINPSKQSKEVVFNDTTYPDPKVRFRRETFTTESPFM